MIHLQKTCTLNKTRDINVKVFNIAAEKKRSIKIDKTYFMCL